MQNDLKNATCDVSWNQTPDETKSSTTASRQHQTESFKVAGSHCPIAFSDSTTVNSSSDLTSADTDEETSYTVLDPTGFGKFNDVTGCTLSVKLHSAFSKPLKGSQRVMGMSGTMTGQIVSQTIGTVNLNGTITSFPKNANVHVETRMVFQFPGFQAVYRDEVDSSSTGAAQQNEKAYLNGAQLSNDEMKRFQGN
jgi:hypothetical protein